jgi:hypothetical protein
MEDFRRTTVREDSLYFLNYPALIVVQEILLQATTNCCRGVSDQYSRLLVMFWASPPAWRLISELLPSPPKGTRFGYRQDLIAHPRVQGSGC